MASRYSRELPVYIVEDHNHALKHIYKLIGSRRMPLEKNIVIHLDSHPDLMIPKNMPAETVFDKEKLFEEISIENWLMPGCFAGHFSSIHWIKPSWSHQIPIGAYELDVGKYKNEIRVHSDIYYFLSDGVCVLKEDLEDVRKVLLTVSNLLDRETTRKASIKSGYILDIDLDFFSTKNPFAEMYKKGDLYAKLKPLFEFELPEGMALNTTVGKSIPDEELVKRVSDERAEQLKELEAVFKCLERTGSIESMQNDLNRVSLSHLTEVTNTVREFYPNIDWEILHSAGLTHDATELPHHVSTQSQLINFFDEFQLFLLHLAAPPVAVTMSRSSVDDYCPPDQVEFIQGIVLEFLERTFGILNIERHYDYNQAIDVSQDHFIT